MVDLFRRGSGATRTRKRFVRRQWARRWLALRHLLVAVLVVAAACTLVWLVWFSSVLAVTGVEVKGTQLLSEQRIRAAAAVPEGQQLARVDLDAARSRIETMAAVETVDLSRQWPDTVRIEVQERTAVAVVDLGSRLRGMDANGVIFRDYEKPPSDLPLVESSEATPEALREAARVVGTMPQDLARRVRHVEVETVDQIMLVLRDDRTVVWGSAAESRLKAEVLDALLEQPGRVLDVSVPESPVTRSTP